MKKQCRRKIWSTTINPVAHAIAGACITDDKALAELHTRELSALEAMMHGNGGLQEWCDLTAVLNLCETAALMGIGPEALPYCRRGHEELLDAARRFEATGRMGLTGVGIQALREVVGYHDLQRRSIPRSQYEQVIRKTKVRTKGSEVLV